MREKKIKETEEDLQKGIFGLDNYLTQIRQMRKMGGMEGVMSLLPGVNKIKNQMKNASVEIIEEIVQHYYKESIPRHIKNKIINGVVSPATLINLRFKCNSKKKFLETLVEDYFTS